MFNIPCPSCGAGLKVKDANLIGKRAKCPKCGHRFLLKLQAEEEAVELELVDAGSPALPAADAPPTGTSARWVPDDPTAGAAGAPAAPAVDPGLAVETAPAFDPTAPLVTDPEGPVSQLSQMRRRRKTSRTPYILGGIGLLLVAGVSTAAVMYQSDQTDTESPETETAAANMAWEDEKATLQARAAAAREASPTDGEPIDLRYLPPGGNIVVHLHPSEIWSTADTRQELVACLGPIGIWLADLVRTHSRFEPQEIEALTFSIALGPRESEPEVGVVIRLKKEQQRSLLISQRFRAPRDGDVDEDLFVDVDGSRAWLLVDEKTFSVGPAALSGDMIDAIGGPAIPSRSIESLILESDRDRHVTAVVDVQALRIHTPTLFDASLQPAVTHFLDWFGEDVEGVAMSFHFGKQLFAETLIRSTNDTTPAKLNRRLRQRLDELPAEMLQMVRHMRPGRAGPRKIIARFPAMAKSFSLATETGISERFVQFTTLLPERAIPNLAIGTLLTWDESTRTDFTRKLAPAETPSEDLPATITERLAQKVDMEFVRTPLEEAFTYLGEESHVRFVVDGEGLKLAGYTKNMAQTFNLGTAPAADGVKAILKQYDKMVLVADEKKLTITVTTKDVVEAQNLKVFTLD